MAVPVQENYFGNRFLNIQDSDFGIKITKNHNRLYLPEKKLACIETVFDLQVYAITKTFIRVIKMVLTMTGFCGGLIPVCATLGQVKILNEFTANCYISFHKNFYGLFLDYLTLVGLSFRCIIASMSYPDLFFSYEV